MIMPRLVTRFRAKPATSLSRAFWNCSPTLFEWILLVLAIVMAVALHLTPVLASGLGKILLAVLASVCFMSPITGFFFIAACSILPYPDLASNEIVRTEGITGANNLATNPASYGVAAWFVITALRYRRFSLSGLSNLWPVIPWLAWYTLVSGTNIFNLSGDYVKSLIYAVMACQLANEACGQYLKCLLGLCLGTLVAIIAFWGVNIGLPIEISSYGVAREGVERMGSTRTDAVMLWPPILMGIAGLLGLALVLLSTYNCRRPAKWLLITAAMLSALSIPPLVSTMTHGAYAGLALMALALAAAFSVINWSGAILPSRTNGIITISFLSVGLVFGMFALDAFNIRTKSQSLAMEYGHTAADSGIAASRTGVWEDSINTIVANPLLGLHGNLASEIITSGFASYGGYASHNVFFDYGRACGIPGMLLVALFFFYPFINACKHQDWIRFIPFLLFHFALLIFWMCLSFWGYKTFWGFWMLMMMATHTSNDHRLSRRIRRSTSRFPIVHEISETLKPV